MTEYWVSQGNKWCDYCKIFIANNPANIRTHEFGQRHKDNVTKRVAAMRKDAAAKEKEQQQALKDLTRIEAQALKSYERDLAAIKSAGSRPPELPAAESSPPVPEKKGVSTPVSPEPVKPEADANEWTYDPTTGYHYNSATGYFYDPVTELYYSEILGKWTTQEEALKASRDALAVSPAKTAVADPVNVAEKVRPPASSKKVCKQSCTVSAPALKATSSSIVVDSSQVSARGARGVASSVALGKRKRQNKPVRVSPVEAAAEAAALAAREAARKRTEEREKSLLGLYQAY